MDQFLKTEVEKMLIDTQREEPNLAMNMSFIPQNQRSYSLVMMSKIPVPKKLCTCFIGTIRKNYTANMWDEDVQKWKDHFGVDQVYYEIPLLPIVVNEKVLDALNSSDAIPRIESALKDINQLKGDEMFRLVCLGTGHSHFLFQAIAYLLKEWKDPSGSLRSTESKQMQFITSGDTEKREMSNFCQWLCISGACNIVEFYNTMTYHPFGYCSSDYPN